MTEPVTTFTKRRDAATPGSIPDVLEMFTREVRFYREVAPYVGVRTPASYHAEEQGEASGPMTFTHGDASALNRRTSGDGEVALLDWEDFGLAPGMIDLTWHLVSSVPPREWDVAITAYGDTSGLADALPSAAVQGLLSFAFEEGHDDAVEWVGRLEEAARRV
jgi:aminoglycoside phosphotransferase (APT) family kinase protein